MKSNTKYYSCVLCPHPFSTHNPHKESANKRNQARLYCIDLRPRTAIEFGLAIRSLLWGEENLEDVRLKHKSKQETLGHGD